MARGDQTVAAALDARTIRGAEALTVAEGGGDLRCLACGHRCLIREGRRGICRVRFNRDGELRVPHGYVGGIACDPIEKKPFFHVLPGANALSFGMLGCDYHCSFCQNWVTSQSLRDPASTLQTQAITPDRIVALARERGAPMVTSTYNEPLITAEWAYDVMRAAKRAGLIAAFVSNGNATPEVLDYLRPVIDCYKVDLKAFTERAYRKMGGTLEAVTRTLHGLVERGFWVEVVTLLIPGMNDDRDEIARLTAFLASLSPDIPWHVTAYHPDYKMTENRPTTIDDLLGAAEIGAAAGLRFVYAGNLPGRVGPWEDTRCPHCDATVVRRSGFQVRENRLDGNNCPDCGHGIPGRWTGIADAR